MLRSILKVTETPIASHIFLTLQLIFHIDLGSTVECCYVIFHIDLSGTMKGCYLIFYITLGNTVKCCYFMVHINLSGFVNLCYLICRKCESKIILLHCQKIKTWLWCIVSSMTFKVLFLASFNSSICIAVVSVKQVSQEHC